MPFLKLHGVRYFARPLFGGAREKRNLDWTVVPWCVAFMCLAPVGLLYAIRAYFWVGWWLLDGMRK